MIKNSLSKIVMEGKGGEQSIENETRRSAFAEPLVTVVVDRTTRDFPTLRKTDRVG